MSQATAIKPQNTDTDPFYSPENMEELSRRVADIKSGKAKLTYHEIIEVEDEESMDG